MGQQLSNSEAQHFRNSARQQFNKSAAQQLRDSAMDAHYCETLLGLCPGYAGDNLPVILCWPVDYLTCR
jgi:hypothetical protein